jgi:predicted ATPase
VINFFQSRTALVIFDNCEHLIEACAQLVNSLLTSCENLSILSTSREVLRISREIPYRVPSLEIPGPDTEFAINEISNMESVKLFTERAAATSPGFAMSQQNALDMARICQRLDGIPLAIELAAARTNVLTVGQILKRLDDRFNLLTSGVRTVLPRQQTLRATIEWSDDLLTEKERILFRRLAVFMGGWTLEAAEEVCSGNGIESSDILDLLSQLVNKSLVLVETLESEKCYHMLETIRQYAREKLLVVSDEEDNIRTRHLKYFLRLSEQAEPALRGPSQIEWMARLNDERDNIRAALEWADETDVEAGLYLSGRLQVFWEIFDAREGARWLAKFAQKSDSRAYLRARATALCAQGRFMFWSQQFAQGRAVAHECLDLYRACGDKYGEVDGLLLSVIFADREQAVELSQRALILAQSINDIWRKAYALLSLSWSQQDRQLAYSYLEEAFTLFQQVGDLRHISECTGELGKLEMLNGDIESAEKKVNDAIIMVRQLNIKSGLVTLLDSYGRIAAVKGDSEQAFASLQEGAAIAEEYGYRMAYLWYRTHLGYLALHQGQITEACDIFIGTMQDFFNDKDENGVVFSLEGIAALFVAMAKPERAARMIGWADATRERIGDTRPLFEKAGVEEIIATCLANMDEVIFSKENDMGRKMTLDEAVSFALEELQ